MALSIAVAAVAVVVGACGGRTYDGIHGGDDGGASDGGGGDGGGACKPLPGCTSTTTCPSPDGCNDCSCFEGAWECAEIACIDASTTCPSTPPTVGTFCGKNQLTCTFGTQCGPEFVCVNYVWSMVIRTCPPPPPGCPPNPPSGKCNGSVGLSCSWGSGCNMEMCDCVATPDGPTWECGGTACVDAGHTGDGGR